ncbi:MAG: D-sedoheptulose 7-phosphate isomerase [Bacteroidia bacterium]|nr:D-sedoheptulose 7-phosphate isomerase [Bacteroidia bacterium]MCZ2247980.1 D-sedoheptulose 7-phosphate isomerase [Bacteroidia bacterium]
MRNDILNDLNESISCLHSFIQNSAAIEAIEKAAHLMIQAYKNGNIIISCGNGGSMCDAMHLAEELSGKFRNDRKALGAIAISDSSYISCAANDYGYQYVFSRYIEGIGKSGDVLVAISTSGNSENIIEACIAAKKKNISIIALTGKDGGKLAQLADVEIRAPFSTYADRAQEIHIKIIHILIKLVEQELSKLGLI